MKRTLITFLSTLFIVPMAFADIETKVVNYFAAEGQTGVDVNTEYDFYPQAIESAAGYITGLGEHYEIFWETGVKNHFEEKYKSNNNVYHMSFAQFMDDCIAGIDGVIASQKQKPTNITPAMKEDACVEALYQAVYWTNSWNDTPEHCRVYVNKRVDIPAEKMNEVIEDAYDEVAVWFPEEREKLLFDADFRRDMYKAVSYYRKGDVYSASYNELARACKNVLLAEIRLSRQNLSFGYNAKYKNKINGWELYSKCSALMDLAGVPDDCEVGIYDALNPAGDIFEGSF